MQRWERRLADLAHNLALCGSTYFDPDLFRQNTNQFLTTARTVSFLIAKDKAVIPNFSRWHDENIVQPWSKDLIMNWAKNSRNHIEKEGDLDLHSQLWVRLIFSYEEEDIILNCERPYVLTANIKRLIRFAEKSLPTGVADASVLKVERRWVANTLPTHELFQALIYVYSCIYFVVRSLTKYLGLKPAQDIPNPENFDEGSMDSRRIRYVKFTNRKSSVIVNKEIERDMSVVAPPWLATLKASMGNDFDKASFTERLTFFSKMAKGVFEQFGNHVAMLWLFNKDGEVVHHAGILPEDQAEKFIFWRLVAERVAYLRATSLIWIAELWVRDNAGNADLPIRKKRILGERLQVVGLDCSGELRIIEWDIVRTTSESSPVLVEISEEGANMSTEYVPHFLTPVYRAFAGTV